MRKLLCGVAGCLFLLSASGEWVDGMSRQSDEVERRARPLRVTDPGNRRVIAGGAGGQYAAEAAHCR
ncbi:hypothetical protein HF329_20310 [Chitinophaga oryzae]|uniref:Uncharacterized protein n=1 Tax=Chitinophaga oryzae TaxID=2725414 RepID=A0AAE6ZLF8_9BACT|nr:hypothetical protein [Chitinophaga oryzae]QJB33530.1 hypothetical protein HF329_20310 [Chitinophaga oryzae]